MRWVSAFLLAASLLAAQSTSGLVTPGCPDGCACRWRVRMTERHETPPVAIPNVPQSMAVLPPWSPTATGRLYQSVRQARPQSLGTCAVSSAASISLTPWRRSTGRYVVRVQHIDMCSSCPLNAFITGTSAPTMVFDAALDDGFGQNEASYSVSAQLGVTFLALRGASNHLWVHESATNGIYALPAVSGGAVQGAAAGAPRSRRFAATPAHDAKILVAESITVKGGVSSESRVKCNLDGLSAKSRFALDGADPQFRVTFGCHCRPGTSPGTGPCPGGTTPPLPAPGGSTSPTSRPGATPRLPTRPASAPVIGGATPASSRPSAPRDVPPASAPSY